MNLMNLNKRINILVADPDRSTREIISKTLEHDNFDLSYCENENDLMITLKNIHFDILILDANLSKIYSIDQFIILLKKMSPSTNIILLYDSSTKINPQKIKNLPIMDVLIKSFEKEKLLMIIDRFMVGCDLQDIQSSNLKYDFVHPQDDGFKQKLKKEIESILEIEIKNTIDLVVAEYSNKHLEHTLKDIVPKMAQSILEKEIKKIGEEIS
ncbi:MAG: response regulator [Oligoflexia bacterium]|nr:response regulator [Oligoflexia bacterium]